MTPPACLLGAVAALALLATPLQAVDVNALVRETQKMSQSAKAIKMAWWLPTQFWRATLEQNAELTEAERAEFAATLEDYTVFALAYIELGAFGDTSPRSREEILSNAKLSLGDRELEPLETDELSPAAAEFFATMRPAMANMMGQIGAGMEFVAYSNVEEGKEIIDPLQQGSLRMDFFDETFTWRLPLGSLMPPMIDPKTSEEFPGNYQYNPYTGAQLEPAASPAPTPQEPAKPPAAPAPKSES